MNPISRRNVLTAAAAGGGLLTAATIASAQSNEPVPQPQRPGHGGTDPGPRNVARDRQNPDILVPPSTDHGTLHVTNKRALVEGKKRIELPRGADVSVNADASTVTIKTDNPKKPLRLKLDEPVYAAAVLDAASQIDERPRGWA